ncbi:MAG: hypothetical protein JWO66_783 [Candidatus Eremiobacteraeota bacterium]|nr:hypothetical protein [Candidatus Eremiobacteraeota bacterium]
MESTVSLRDRITAGLVAGLAGGVLIDLFQFGMQLAGGTPPDRLLGNFVFIATAALGPGAATGGSAVPIGVILHFAVSIGWALGYVYLAGSQPQVVTRPLVSGAVFGLVVFIFMEIVLITAGQYHRPPPALLGTLLAAHIVFFGIPVALIVSRLLRTA